MRTRTAALCFIAALLLTACGGTSWQEFTSSDGGFSVSMPGAPEQNENTSNTAAGLVVAYTFSVSLSNNAYSVTYADYPTDLVELAGPDTLLQGAIDGIASGGTLLSQRAVTLGDLAGQELQLEVRDSSIPGGVANSTMRVYLSGSRMYLLQAVNASSAALSADMAKFFDSFTLLAQ